MKNIITSSCGICPSNQFRGQGWCPISKSIENSKDIEALKGMNVIGDGTWFEFAGDIELGADSYLDEKESHIIAAIQSREGLDQNKSYKVSYQAYETVENDCDPGYIGKAFVYTFTEVEES